jgi:membrane-anchored glycerophosphoryl diester phosphodiesterase (GDPDase)
MADIILDFDEFRGLWKMLHYFVCNFFTSVLLSLIMTCTGFPKAYLILDYWTMSLAKMYLCAVNEYQDQ